MASMREKIRGMFLGTAIGDALGMPMETFTAEEIQQRFGRVTTYMAMPEDHKWHHNLPAGATTDDTQLTLAVARAIIKSDGKFDMDKIAREHVVELAWGSSTWGPSTRDAVTRLKNGVHWSESGKTDKPNTGMGNGVVMKLAPLVVCLRGRSSNQVEQMHQFTAMTHATVTADVATLFHSQMLVRMLLFQNVLDFDIVSFRRMLETAHVATFLNLPSELLGSGESYIGIERPYGILGRNIFRLSPVSIQTFWGDNNFIAPNTICTSYAYIAQHSRCLMESMYDAVNAGGDTDSLGSIVGGMIGALHGPAIFPDHLVAGLLNYSEVIKTADELCNVLDVV